MGDREADVFDLLAAEHSAGVDLLVRAAWDRCVEGPERHVWATVEAHSVMEHLCLQVPRRGTQPGREATLALRFCPVTLYPPRHRQAEGLPCVTLWAVQVREIDPPLDVQPIEWLLLTTVAVQTADDACERVLWYACRWGIEVWHRILKSGCRIEARQLATAERLQRCLTLYSVIAWRVLYATMLARAVPGLPCSVLLEIEAWQALYCAIHQCATPPDEPPSLAQAVHWLAQLGGFVGRRRRDQPGTEMLWRGFQHLMDLTKMYHMLGLATALSAPRIIRRWRTGMEHCFRPLQHRLATEACPVHSADAYSGPLVWRLMASFVVFDLSRVLCQERLTTAAIIFSRTPSWRSQGFHGVPSRRLPEDRRR